MNPEECQVHIKRVDDLEQRVEAHHVRLHKQANEITEVKMQAGILDVDFNHHQRDVLKSIEANRDATVALRKSIEAMAAVAQEEREKRLALEAEVGQHGRAIKWVISSVTAVGVGCAIAVLAHLATKSP